MRISGRTKKWWTPVLVVVLAVSCLGLMRTEAAGAIEVDRRCSLTVVLDAGGEAAGNEAYLEDLNRMEIPVSVYRVAEVDTTGRKFTPEEPFTDLDFSTVMGEAGPEAKASDWMELATEAKKILDERNPEAAGHVIVRCGETDTSATLSGTIEGLETGIYLVSPGAVYNGDYTVLYQFTPYLTALPSSPYGLEGTGSDAWEYDTVIGLKADAQPQFGKLKITKSLREYNETLGPATFVFQVMGVDEYGNVRYDEVESLTFDKAGSNTITLEGIPAGLTVTVTEIYSGASYVIEGPESGSALIWSDAALLYREPRPEEASVSFTNRYGGGNRGGYGVTNHFESDGEGGWLWENPTALPEE